MGLSASATTTTTFYNSLTLPIVTSYASVIATYYLDYVSVKLLNLSECYNVMSLLCCNFVLLILSLNEYLTTLIAVEYSINGSSPMTLGFQIQSNCLLLADTGHSVLRE